MEHEKLDNTRADTGAGAKEQDRSAAGSMKPLYERTRAALEDGTSVNPIKVRISSESQSGFRSRIRIRDFEITSDQPPGFGGSNAGPKPSELLLAALAACQEMTWRLYADAMDVDLRGVSVELEGTQDLNGFLGTGEAVPAGFQSIKGTVHIDSGASDAKIEKLQQVVDAHCPILDDLVRHVPVALEMARVDNERK